MKIAVLSRNGNLYSTKRLVEAAKERGHAVEVVRSEERRVGKECRL